MRAEVDDVLGDRAPTIDDLRALPLTLGAVQEVLRMWPPGPAAPRMSIAPSELHGMEIPAGRLVLYSAYVTGRLPELWPDPERFDPARWAPGAPEPVPYSFVPFGGGYRRCIGFALATLELQVMAVRLVQQVEWRLRRADRAPDRHRHPHAQGRRAHRGHRPPLTAVRSLGAAVDQLGRSRGPDRARRLGEAQRTCVGRRRVPRRRDASRSISPWQRRGRC